VLTVRGTAPSEVDSDVRPTVDLNRQREAGASALAILNPPVTRYRVDFADGYLASLSINVDSKIHELKGVNPLRASYLFGVEPRGIVLAPQARSSLVMHSHVEERPFEVGGRDHLFHSYRFKMTEKPAAFGRW